MGNIPVGGGGGTTSPLTTKGDLWGFSQMKGFPTGNARVPVGSDGQVLTANSAVNLGLDWSNPSSSVAWGAITGTLSDQTDLNSALALKAALASPALTGNPTAPTQSAGNNSTRLA